MFKLNINRKLLLMKICFFLFDGATAPINAFMPIIARQRGISVFIVGMIFTCMPVFNVIVRPSAGFVTDRWRCRKKVFLGVSLVNVFLTLAIHFTPDFVDDGSDDETYVFRQWQFWLFFVTITCRAVLWMAGDVLQDTICMEILGDDKESYGRQRIFGAVGYGLSSLLVGLFVDWYSRDQEKKNYLPAYVISMVFQLCHFTVASKLECNQKSISENMTKDVVKVLSDIKVVSYLIWAVFAGVFTAYIWFYLFLYIEDLANIYHHERLPYIETIQGLSLTIQCGLSEIPVYVLTGYILKRIGHMTAYSVSFAVFSMRFFVYSIIKDPLWVLPVELTNGISFALAFVSGVSYAAKVAPVGSEGTLQGLFGMAFQGIGIALGCFSAGYTFERFGSSAAFRLLSYVGFIVFFLQVLVNQLIKRNKLKQNKDEPKELF